jgi:hypothetical protein
MLGDEMTAVQRVVQVGFVAMLVAALAWLAWGGPPARAAVVAAAAAAPAPLVVPSAVNYTGWAETRGSFAADVITDAWAWTGSGWVRHVHHNYDTVWVTPYTTGWVWTWTPWDGWWAMRASDVDPRATIGNCAVVWGTISHAGRAYQLPQGWNGQADLRWYSSAPDGACMDAYGATAGPVDSGGEVVDGGGWYIASIPVGTHTFDFSIDLYNSNSPLSHSTLVHRGLTVTGAAAGSSVRWDVTV